MNNLSKILFLSTAMVMPVMFASNNINSNININGSLPSPRIHDQSQ